MKKLISRVVKVIAPLAALPGVVWAQGGGQIDQLVQAIKTTLGYVIAILFVLLTIYFIWGVVQYVTAGGDEEKLAKGKQHMIWGIIGMAVAGAAWGIVSIIWGYLGVTGGGTLPSINL